MDKNLGILDQLNKSFGEFWNKKNLSGKVDERNQGEANDAANIDGADRQELTYWSLLNETRKKGERRRSSSRDKSEVNLKPGERKQKMGNQESLNGVVPKEELEQYIPLSDKGGSSAVKSSSSSDDMIRDKENRAVDSDADANRTRRMGEKKIPRTGENKTGMVKSSGEKIYSREEYIDSKKVEVSEKRSSRSENPVKKIEDSESLNSDEKKVTGEPSKKSQIPESSREIKGQESSDVKEDKPNTLDGNSKLQTEKNLTNVKAHNNLPNVESEEVKKFLEGLGNFTKSDKESSNKGNSSKPLDSNNAKQPTTAGESDTKAPLPSFDEGKISKISKLDHPSISNLKGNSIKKEGDKVSHPAIKTENESSKIPKLENPSKILASISSGMEVKRTSLAKNSNAQEPVKQVTEKLISSVVCGHIMEVSEKNPRKLGVPSSHTTEAKATDAPKKTNLEPKMENVESKPNQENAMKVEEVLTENKLNVLKETVNTVLISKGDDKKKEPVKSSVNVINTSQEKFDPVVVEKEEDKISGNDETLKTIQETIPARPLKEENHTSAPQTKKEKNVRDKNKTIDLNPSEGSKKSTEENDLIADKRSLENLNEGQTKTESIKSKEAIKDLKLDQTAKEEIKKAETIEKLELVDNERTYTNASKQECPGAKENVTKPAETEGNKNVSNQKLAPADCNQLPVDKSNISLSDEKHVGKFKDPLKIVSDNCQTTNNEGAERLKSNENIDPGKICEKFDDSMKNQSTEICFNHQNVNKDILVASIEKKASGQMESTLANNDCSGKPPADANQEDVKLDRSKTTINQQKLNSLEIKENDTLNLEKKGMDTSESIFSKISNDKLTKIELDKSVTKNNDSNASVNESSNKVSPATEVKQLPLSDLVDKTESLNSSATSHNPKAESKKSTLDNLEKVPSSIVEQTDIVIKSQNKSSISKESEKNSNDEKIIKNKVEDPEIDELKRLLLDKLKLANSAPITTTGINDIKKLEVVSEGIPKTSFNSEYASTLIQQKSVVSTDASSTEDAKKIVIENNKNKTEVTSHELNRITEEDREKGTQSSLSNRSSTDLDSRAMSPFSDAGSGTATPRRRRSVKSRRQSSGNKSSSESSSRRDSRAFSPFESNSRRGSRALSPLSSFSNIQEKIQALSRDSSQSEIIKKTPKIHKLDDKILMIGKEPAKVEKLKDPIKVMPKIDATLQSKILKFGVPSGAKLPKKTEPMKAEKSYSVVGGFAIKDPEESKESATDSSKAKPYRRNKPKAPLPPGQQDKLDGGNEESESVPTTPNANRHEMKVKKVKGKAPPPPVQNSELSEEAAKVHGDIMNMTNEINQLLEDTKHLHRETKTLPTSPKAKRRSSKPGTPSSVRKLSLKEEAVDKETKNCDADSNNNKVSVDKKRRSSKSEPSKNSDILQVSETKVVAVGEIMENEKNLLNISATKETQEKLDISVTESKILYADEKNRNINNKTVDIQKGVSENTEIVDQTKEVKESGKIFETEKSLVVAEKKIKGIEGKDKKRPDNKNIKENKIKNIEEEIVLQIVEENTKKIDNGSVKEQKQKPELLAEDNKRSKTVVDNNNRRSSNTELLDKKDIIKESKTDNTDKDSYKRLVAESQTKVLTKDKKGSESGLVLPPQESVSDLIKSKGVKDINSKANLLSKPTNETKENAEQQKPYPPKNVNESKIPTLKPNEEKGPKISPQTARKDQHPAEDSISLASSSSRDSFETLKSSRSPSPSSYESCNEADRKKLEKQAEVQSQPEEKEQKVAVEKKVKYSSRGEIIPDDGTIKPLGTYKSTLESVKESSTIMLVPAYRPENTADLHKPEEPVKGSVTIPLVLAYRPDVIPEEPKPEPKSKTHSLIESIRKQLKNSEILKTPDNEPKSEEDLSLSDSLTISYGAVKRKPSSDLTSYDNKFEKYEKHLKRYEEMFSPERTPFTPEGTPFSDFSDDSYDHYVTSDYSLDSSVCENQSSRRSSRCSSTPRRFFPQIAKPTLYEDDKTKEDSPVIFDAGLSFDLCSKRNRTPVRQLFQPQPAFSEPKTVSNSLSTKIADFLNRTDHVMEEWKRLGKSDSGDLKSCVELPSYASAGHPKSKSKSATNIMIKGLLNYSRGSSVRSPSRSRYSESSDRTLSDLDELSEMAVDLTEERATANLQAERLEAETTERIRLEQELSQIQHEKKNLQQTSERLEMELFYARADVNGLSEGEADLEDGNADAGIYKQKCERIMRELEFTRRRLQQQHEDDLEQLVGLKKQLEKKLSDAYEEVEEQRQVVGQWKRKVQKLQAEMNDLRLLLEEQSSRNNLLEKKQRKFDSEIQMLQDELRSEKNQRDRASREKEIAVAEKYSMEQNLSSVRLELELKEEKLASLTRELDELTRGGGSEQEVTQLRKAKHDLELKLKEQEEELDELAGQVSMLEGNKLRLEMSLESLRKDHRREMTQRDDELDEVRSNAHKKVKALESQLESEHEERTLLLREKHELERRLNEAEERGRHYRAADEDALLKLRRDLKKTKALLRDAQVMLERAKQDSPSKAALRQLKNQLEDAELARASAVKAKQSLESELNEVSGQLEEALRAKGDAENRYQAAQRESNALRTQVDENEEELAELLKKYRSTVQQLSAEQLANQETAGALAEAEAERASLKDQLAELTAKLEASSNFDPTSGIAQKRLEIRIKELESRLELEQTTRGRLEVQIARLKENVERLTEECVQARTKEQAASDLTRKLQRSLRETKEELAQLQAKEQEFAHKKKDLEKRLETAEQEAMSARTDLRLAVKRIEDLQNAISGEIGSDSERSDSEVDSDSGDDSLISQLPSGFSSARTSRTPDVTPR